MKYLKTFEGLTTPTIEKIVSDIRDMCVINRRLKYHSTKESCKT